MKRTKRWLTWSAGGVALAGALLLGAWAAGIVTAEPAAPSQVERVKLRTGCNNVALTWRGGTPVSTVAAAAAPADNLVAVWRFNNDTQRFEGFAPRYPDRSDLTHVDRLDAVFLCVLTPGTLTRPMMVLVNE